MFWGKLRFPVQMRTEFRAALLKGISKAYSDDDLQVLCAFTQLFIVNFNGL